MTRGDGMGGVTLVRSGYDDHLVVEVLSAGHPFRVLVIGVVCGAGGARRSRVECSLDEGCDVASETGGVLPAGRVTDAFIDP